MKINILLAALLLLLVSCGDDNPTTGTEYPNFAKSLSGYVQKGPFVNGTAITVSDLKANLTPTGNTFETQIVDNKGSFELRDISLESPYVKLKANGYFFNEVTGIKSVAPITLYALSDITDKNTVNVNLISHLENSRVDYLVGKGSSFAKAKKQASREVLAMFYITDSISSAENLDISQPADENAILLAISVMLLGELSEGDFTEFLSNISTDIRDDGQLNSVSLFDKIVQNAKALDTDKIRTNITKMYSDLGVSASIGDFEKYILNFINSSGTINPQIVSITPNGGAVNGLTQTFTATIASPFNSTIANYKLDFNGDGVWDVEKSGTSNSVSISENYTYATYGNYTYTIYIADAHGNESEQSYDITVTNIEAQVSGLEDKDITINDIVNFSISLKDDDRIETVYIDFGEGDISRPQYDTIVGMSEFTVSHQYPSYAFFMNHPELVSGAPEDENIIFPLTVTSVDIFGNEMVERVNVTVHKGEPIISNLLPTGASKGLKQIFSADLRDLYGGKLVSYRIDCDGDGYFDIEDTLSSSTQSISAVFKYEDFGDYLYIFEATDDDGNIAIKKGKISILGNIIYVKVDGDYNSYGTSWENATNSIQKAYDIATEVNADEIWISKGVYYNKETESDSYFKFDHSNHVKVIGGFSGIEIDKLQRDSIHNVTIFSGDISKNDTDLDENHYTDLNGIIVDNTTSNTISNHIYINKNTSLYSIGITGSYEKNIINNGKLFNITISGNKFTATMDESFLITNNGELYNCEISNNITSNNSSFISNKGSIQNTLINNNEGGLSNYGELKAIIYTNNDAIFTYTNSIIFNSLIKDNSSLNFSPIEINGGSIINTTIVENEGSEYTLQIGGMNISIINTTIVNNTPSKGTIIFHEGLGLTQCKIMSSIISDTFINSIDTVAYLNPYHPAFYPLEISIENTILNQENMMTFQVKDLLILDPLLGPLQDNGGPVPTMALLPGSPAIDAGTTEGAPTTDARGILRDSKPDIGAYEYEK